MYVTRIGKDTKRHTTTAVTDSSSHHSQSGRASTLEPIKLVDQHRIILTNVPSNLDQDFLELYLEYLSDEVEIERFDLGEEILNSIVVTYKKFVGKEN